MHQIWNLILLLAVFICGASNARAFTQLEHTETGEGLARIISCYNDDSLDAVNQNVASIWVKPTLGRIMGRSHFELEPADCVQSPTVNLDRDGIVRIDGKIAYENAMDPIVEARRAPSGIVALLTEKGSVWIYQNGSVKVWYESQSYQTAVTAFVIARNGAVMASTREARLVVDGALDLSIRTVSQLKASVGGRTVALLDNGALRDAGGYLYQAVVDPIVDFKLAADGTVVWKSQQGRLGSTKTANIYDFTGDPVHNFKVSPSGRVAYITTSGKLMRDRQDLSSNGVLSITEYRIHADGSVTATATDGRELYFKP